MLRVNRRGKVLICFDSEGSNDDADTFETLDHLAGAGIEHVADCPMGDRPFDIRTKHGTLALIPHMVEPNDIPMMLIQHHKAAQ